MADPSSRSLFGVALGGLGSLFVAGALVGIRGEIANVNVALALVLVVLAAATLGGRSAGTMSGLVAATSFDFFHTRPYGSLKIASPNHLVTTLLLLTVGLAVGEASERSGRFQERMGDDPRHLRRLHRVTSLAVSGVEDERDLVMAVTAELIDALGLEHCSFEWPPFVHELPHLRPDGTVAGLTAGWIGGDVDFPSAGVDLRVMGRGHTIGRFVLVPGPGTTASAGRLLVAVALAQELGLALATTVSSRQTTIATGPGAPTPERAVWSAYPFTVPE